MLPKILPRRFVEQRRAEAYRRFLRRQARMGGALFGPLPAGRRREFFCLDRHTWVWHEEWLDDNKQARSLTTRYDITPRGVVKSQGNLSYQLVTGEELQNFYQAACMFRDNLHRQATNQQA